MTLQEACQILSDFSGIQVAFLETEDQCERFCNAYQFHSIQEYLTPQSLRLILAGLTPGEVLHVLDVFHIRFVIFLASGGPVAVGPYCTEMFMMADCKLLLKQLGLPETLSRDLGTYRSPFPVVSEREVRHLIRCLSKNIGLNLDVSHAQLLDYEKSATANYLAQAVKKPYAELVRERYQIETQLMENIRQGDRVSAIENWRKLHRSVAFLKQLGQTMETARIAAAIFRTTLRIIAMEVGIPAVVNDQISGESASVVRQATTVEEIDQEHEQLIRKYCRAIHEYRNKNYSGVVLSAIYCIERQYARELSIPEIAEELDVSPNHLITRFRKETGMTPNAYLCRVRMRQAAKLLVASGESIQAVSAQVGILDANYFTKLFKREYGETPANYRKTHKL